MTWTNLKGTGKADANSEEGWTLLPDGTVLTIDTKNVTQSERYLPSTDTWVPAGSTASLLVGSGAEIGPQVLRPSGTVFVAGATGHTGVYNVAAGTWAAGPDFPVSDGEQLVNNDGPATLLPSGNVLVTAFNSQSYFFFEFDGASLNPAPVPPPGGCFALLLLPTGQVLCNSEIYTPTGSPNPAWAPTIATAPSVVQPGFGYTLTGTQFNGLSQAVAFGDDYQGATNYPLVRITNVATGHVFYCRTFNHSTMAVATGAAVVFHALQLPAIHRNWPLNPCGCRQRYPIGSAEPDRRSRSGGGRANDQQRGRGRLERACGNRYFRGWLFLRLWNKLSRLRAPRGNWSPRMS